MGSVLTVDFSKKEFRSQWEITAPFGESIMRVHFGRHHILCWVIVKASENKSGRVAVAIIEPKAPDNSNEAYAHTMRLITQDQLDHADVLDEFSEIEEMTVRMGELYPKIKGLEDRLDRVTLVRVFLNIKNRHITPDNQLGTLRAINDAIHTRERIRFIFEDDVLFNRMEPILE